MKMRKNGLGAILLIVFVTALFMVSYQSVLSASEVLVNSINSTFDQTSKLVKVSGALSSGSGQNITIRITDPKGGINFVNQTITGENGQFSFQYILIGTNTGTYTVEINAKGMNTPTKTEFTYKTASKYILGDLNGDERINSTDYVLLRRYILGIIVEFPVEYGFDASDLNGDGKTNSTDYAFMRRYILGMINEFPAK